MFLYASLRFSIAASTLVVVVGYGSPWSNNLHELEGVVGEIQGALQPGNC